MSSAKCQLICAGLNVFWWSFQAEVEEKRIQGTLQFVTLKKMNRLAHIRCKKAREATNEVNAETGSRNRFW